MNIIDTDLDGVKIIEPSVFKDNRGYFMETYQQQRYKNAGIRAVFCQNNYSFSIQGTLRGLHYQYPNTQAKLVQVLQGNVYDVAVDIRQGSPDFGKWAGVWLSGDNCRQLYIPKGFAHGFCVASKTAMFTYQCDDYYNRAAESGILWSDPEIGIDWPITDPEISEKDATFGYLRNMPIEKLPEYHRI